MVCGCSFLLIELVFDLDCVKLLSLFEIVVVLEFVIVDGTFFGLNFFTSLFLLLSQIAVDVKVFFLRDGSELSGGNLGGLLL